MYSFKDLRSFYVDLIVLVLDHLADGAERTNSLWTT